MSHIDAHCLEEEYLKRLVGQLDLKPFRDGVTH